MQKSIYEKFMEKAVARVAKMRRATRSIRHDDRRAGLERSAGEDTLLHDIGRKEGAKVLIGGERNRLEGELKDGYYVKPTVLEGHNRMRVFQEEISARRLGCDLRDRGGGAANRQ